MIGVFLEAESFYLTVNQVIDKLRLTVNGSDHGTVPAAPLTPSIASTQKSDLESALLQSLNVYL